MPYKGLALLALLVASHVRGAGYPERPIRVLVPFVPGGNVDIAARSVAPELTTLLGQSIIIDNRGGAHGTIAAEIVKKAAPDGHTLMLTSSGMLAIAPALGQKLPYDVARDFAPVGAINLVPLAMVVHPALPVATVREFIAWAKGRAGGVSMATSGSGSTAELAGALFQSLTGTRLVAVAYKGGGPAQVDLAAGHVAVYFDQISGAIAFVNSGKTRALAVLARTRVPQLPGVPTMAEAGVPGGEASTFTGLLAPTGTPAGIVQRLNTALNAALRSSTVAERFSKMSASALEGTADDLARLMREETAKWARVAREAGIKGEQ